MHSQLCHGDPTCIAYTSAKRTGGGRGVEGIKTGGCRGLRSSREGGGLLIEGNNLLFNALSW